MEAVAVKETKKINKIKLSKSAQRFLRHPSSLPGLLIMGFFLSLVVFGPLIVEHSPTASNWSLIRKPPSLEHWFGTDELGRDIFSRMIYGARTSMSVSLLSVCFAVSVGVPLGILAGYYKGKVDLVISKCTEALMSIPSLVLAIALAAVLGPGIRNAMLAIGIGAVPLFIRLARGQTISLSGVEYIEAVQSMGASDFRIMIKHILPNIAAPLFVQVTLTMASAIISESSLSFLGLGIQPPEASWGTMLNSAKNFLSASPWMGIYPGLAIMLLVFAFNLLGDALRDAFDPKGHKE